jgi:hypothetical protein
MLEFSSMYEPTNFAPYGAPENAMRVLERVRKNGLPGSRRIVPDYLLQLGIGEGMVPRTIRTLEYLGFIREDGSATELLDRFTVAGDDEWRLVLQEAVRTAYDSIFRVVDPAEATRAQVLTAFRPMQPNGQWNRMVTLFLGLCLEAGLEVKDPPKQRPGKDAVGTPVRDRVRPLARPVVSSPGPSLRQDQPRQRGYQGTFITLPAFSGGNLHPALAGIVASIPELQTTEDLDRWIASFRATFLMVKKVDPTG